MAVIIGAVAAAVVGAAVSSTLNSGTSGQAGGYDANAAALAATQADIAKQQFAFWQQNYAPLETQLSTQVGQLTSPAYQEQQAAQQGATTAGAYDTQAQNLNRSAFSYGLAPNSGPYAAQMGALAAAKASGVSATENNARWNTLMGGLAQQQNTAALGRGLPMSAMTGLQGASNSYQNLANSAWGRYYANAANSGYAFGPAANALGSAAGNYVTNALTAPQTYGLGTSSNYNPNTSGSPNYMGGGQDSPYFGGMAGNNMDTAGAIQPTAAPTSYADGGLARISRRAPGGSIEGPGTETSDSIPASVEGQQDVMLSDGEHVMNTDAVRILGRNFLDAANMIGLMKRYRSDEARGYASGGAAIAGRTDIEEGGMTAQPETYADQPLQEGGLRAAYETYEPDRSSVGPAPEEEPASDVMPNTMPFGRAFNAASRAGLQTFDWRGSKYTTQQAQEGGVSQPTRTVQPQGQPPQAQPVQAPAQTPTPWPRTPDGEFIIDAADHLPFKTAFDLARRSGMPGFTWRGKQFSTAMKRADGGPASGGRGSVYASDVGGAKQPVTTGLARVAVNTGRGDTANVRDFGLGRASMHAEPVTAMTPQDAQLEQAQRIGPADEAQTAPMRDNSVRGQSLERPADLYLDPITVYGSSADPNIGVDIDEGQEKRVGTEFAQGLRRAVRPGRMNKGGEAYGLGRLRGRSRSVSAGR